MSSESDSLEFELPKHNTEQWAMSLADLFSIVLSIFVLLFAVSATNRAKTASAVNGIRGKFAIPNVTETKDVARNLDSYSMTHSSSGDQHQPLREYYAQISKVAKESLALEDMYITNKGNVMILHFPVEMLFVGETALLDDKELFMQELADQLSTTASNLHLDVEFLAGYSGKESSLAIDRAGVFVRSMTALGVNQNSLYAGIQAAEPDMISIIFSPRDETRSSLVF